MNFVDYFNYFLTFIIHNILYLKMTKTQINF